MSYQGAQSRLVQAFPILKYYSLILSISISDLKLRYRNSFLGFIWSFLEPLLILGVLYVVFSSLFASQSIPNYPLFLLLGLIMWNMYSRSTQSSLNSFLSKGGMVSKVYFPREILPIAACITTFIMMTFEFAAFGVFMVIFQFVPTITIGLLPFLLGVLFILSLGISLILSIANVYFRDMQYIWNVLLQAGFFLTPIFYNLDIYPAEVRDLLLLSPIASLLDVGHKVVLYDVIPWSEMVYPVLASFAILAIGYLVFKKFESRAVEKL